MPSPGMQSPSGDPEMFFPPGVPPKEMPSVPEADGLRVGPAPTRRQTQLLESSSESDIGPAEAASQAGIATTPPSVPSGDPHPELFHSGPRRPGRPMTTGI